MIWLKPSAVIYPPYPHTQIGIGNEYRAAEARESSPHSGGSRGGLCAAVHKCEGPRLPRVTKTSHGQISDVRLSFPCYRPASRCSECSECSAPPITLRPLTRRLPLIEAFQLSIYKEVRRSSRARPRL